MSPEQVKAEEITKQSDIYSLGITFYEMLTGVGPYKDLHSEFAIYEKIVRDPLKSLVDIMGQEYAQAWSVISKATAKDPMLRYSCCLNFLRDLQALSDIEKERSLHSGISDTRMKVEEPFENLKRKKSVPLFLKILIVVIGIFIFVLLINNLQHNDTVATDVVKNYVAKHNAEKIKQTLDNYYAAMVARDYEVQTQILAAELDTFVLMRNTTNYKASEASRNYRKGLGQTSTKFISDICINQTENGYEANYWLLATAEHPKNKDSRKYQFSIVPMRVRFNHEFRIKTYVQVQNKVETTWHSEEEFRIKLSEYDNYHKNIECKEGATTWQLKANSIH